MSRFIELTGMDGKAVLVNSDRISMVRSTDEGVVLVMDGKETAFPTEKMSKVKDALEDNSMERISTNLFHIWEILRARLH